MTTSRIHPGLSLRASSMWTAGWRGVLRFDAHKQLRKRPPKPDFVDVALECRFVVIT